MMNQDNIPEIEPDQQPSRSVSVYGSADAMDDFPVLKAFQQYIDAEQAKAQKRMTTLCIFFAIIMASVIGVFVVILMSMSQRNNSLNDQIFQMMLKDRDRSGSQVVVQSPAAPQNDAAIKFMSDTMTLLQKQMQDQQKQMADQQLRFMEQQSKATEAAMNAAASRAVAAMTPPPSPESAGPSPEQLALEQKNQKEKERIEKSLALLKSEREKMEKEREALKQQQIELQRRRLYPDLYDANGNLIVKKPEPKTKPQPVVVRDEDEDDEDDEIEALVAATKKLTKKAAATTPSTPAQAPKQYVKPIQQNDGTVRYFDEEDDEDDVQVAPKKNAPVQNSAKPIMKKDGTIRYFDDEDDDVEDLKVPAPKLIPAVPIPPAASQKELTGKGDGATSSWIIPLE